MFGNHQRPPTPLRQKRGLRQRRGPIAQAAAFFYQQCGTSTVPHMEAGFLHARGCQQAAPIVQWTGVASNRAVAKQQVWMPDGEAMSLAKKIVGRALGLGFDAVGIAPVRQPLTIDRYGAWLSDDYHGEMAYLSRSDAKAKRADIRRLLPGVRSIVSVATNYFAGPLSGDLRDDPSLGIISSFARGSDYHSVLTARLQRLGAFVQQQLGSDIPYRAYVDTGPILEREIAARAGLGFVGKNANLIHPQLGSWLLLGELLLSVEACSEQPECKATSPDGDLGELLRQGTCGRCTRCLDACPTGAFVAPYVLDSRRCISYLTVELKGPIPTDLRPMIGNRVFGCDVCQQVCPWNRRFARPTSGEAFRPGPGAMSPRLLDLMSLDDAAFRRRFSDTPVRRTKRRGLLRNVVVALGNWADPAATPALSRALDDVEPLIRGHAAWALGQIASETARRALEEALATETDEWVRSELRASL
jgi:epoxyqueuosine reductase